MAREAVLSDRMRRKTLAQLRDHSKTERAKRYALLAAERAWKSCDDGLLVPSRDSDSVESSEVAMRRGMQRGSSERNERLYRDDNTDLPRITEESSALVASRSPPSLARFRSHLRRRPRHRPLQTSNGSDCSSATKSRNNNTKQSDADAWMCGVCGVAYATESACRTHEVEHIRKVLLSLEWMTTKQPATVRTAADATKVRASTSTSSSNHSPTPFSSMNQQHRHKNTPHNNLHPDDHPALLQATTPTSLDASDGYPRLDADLPSGALVPKPRSRSNTNNTLYEDPLLGPHNEYDDLLLSNDLKDFVVLADEALCNVMETAVPMILDHDEVDAERTLALLARDKAYYDDLAQRANRRRVDPSNRFRLEDDHFLAKVQNKLLDAYQLMKESDGLKGTTDAYQRKTNTENIIPIQHSARTLYVNVMVKNSVQVVRHELERLAKERWESSNNNNNSVVPKKLDRFERFRNYTQTHAVKLAGFALASDFTPRRIAVQLSNDLYRLLTPRLKRRGVEIETEIEYRVGPYFVLAVNIKHIDWWKLIRATRRDVERRERVSVPIEGGGFYKRQLSHLAGLFSLSLFDTIASALSILYHFHWTVYLPICYIAYRTMLGIPIRQFILASVTDEIFFYVEEKGMSMDIKVNRTERQAAFMLSALREIRADGQQLKKKREEEAKLGAVLGPLLGPAVSSDKGPAPELPIGFELPENLEYVGLELDLPIGFQRCRWAFLSQKSEFITEALYKTEARYEQIEMGEWDKQGEWIGESKLPEDVDPNDFLGAEKTAQYLMPKSAFVSANMCYETSSLIAYNDYCFCLKKHSRNPDAPFGKTFVAWTQYLVINTGENSCRLICSVQPEFPNGEPMVSRQIRSGMRAGTGELFVLIGETVTKYANEFP